MAKSIQTDPMAPEASPGATSRGGVRRVNNIPLVIAAAALALFVGLIAMVAVKRANRAMAAAPDASQQSKKNTDSSEMANDIVGGHGVGVIPAHTTPPPPTLPAQPTDTPAIPIAPVPNPNAPPMPPRTALTPRDPQALQIERGKLQDFEAAVKSKTKVQLPYGSSLAGSAAGAGGGSTKAPQTREQMLAQLANVRRQIDANAASNDPTEAYKAQLAKIQASVAGGASGGLGSSLPGAGTGFGLVQSSTNANKDSSQFGKHGPGDRWSLNEQVQAPTSRFEIRAGDVIPGIMISGINSDLPGQIMGQVGQDVYDTATGRYLLIPQGTRLVGTYNSNVAYGQSAVLIAWQRLTFPDGKVLDIGSMPGADAAGYSGFRDEVNNHYIRIFASAFLMSGVTAAASYATDRNTTNSFNSQPTASSELSQALGQQLGNVTAQMIAKNLNIAPTLEIRPGYRFNIIATRDMVFTEPYKPFDYSTEQ
jgi:type IV secretion system protein VirB10